MVTRCVCKNVDFRTIAALHAAGLSLRQIIDRTACTTGCGTCGPYVRLVITTGRTSWPVLTESQAARIMHDMPLDPPSAAPMA